MNSEKQMNSENTPPELNISLEKVCYIIIKATEWNAKTEVVEPDPGSNEADDAERMVLEDYADDPTYIELRDAIAGLNWDEQIALVALAWLGRGSYTLDEWQTALEDAQRERVHSTEDYLLGTPLLGEYLEEGLSEFGLSCEEMERQHL